jgi:acetoacetyl-CoA synthetase
MTLAAGGLPRGELLWEPPADILERTRIGHYMGWLERERGHTFSSYQDLWRWSSTEIETFWASLWDYFEIRAGRQPERVLDSRQMPGARWFAGATLNYADHALSPGEFDDTAIVARSQTRPGETLTRAELRRRVGAAQAGMRELGIGRGDRVGAYLPNVTEAVVAFLAAAGLGATWSVCPPEFGADAALNRLGQFEPDLLLSVDGYRWGRKAVDRRAEVKRLAGELPSLRAAVHVPYLDPDALPPPGAVSWSELLGVDAEPHFEEVPFDHPLWVLFSSGTTGRPKAFVHGHGGMVLENLKSLALHHDLRPGERMFFYSTTGWMVWNQVVSALLVGAGAVLLDGDPLYPAADALWELAADTGLTHFGTSASFLMHCVRAGVEPAAERDLSSVRFLKTAGSPLPADGYRWVGERFPGVFFSSSSGGTEICGAFVGGIPILPVRAGQMAGRYLGVAADAWDGDGNPVVEEPGELVLTEPLPAMPLRLLEDQDFERYRAEYFDVYPGVWRHGDWFVLGSEGSCAILGRSDATLNRGGVRLGTGEFYAVLDKLPEIEGSLVVHLEGDDGGLGELILFVALPTGGDVEKAGAAAVQALRSRLSPRHIPDRIVAVPEIPAGPTGKRLEVPVKRILQGARPADVLSVEDVDPVTLETMIDIFRQRADKAGVP